jgi:Kef-type K+ transport system membrane component KefB
MRRVLIILLISFCALLFLARTIQAEAGAGSGDTGGAGHGLDPTVLIGIAVILVVAKLSGELFERFRQPAVLGELLGGIILGNLAVFGFTAVEPLKSHEVIGALAEIGVIILLFEVGLESNIGEMMEVGWSSLLVAAAGVIAPFLLGWGVAAYYLPGESQLGHIFIGATLCATSVGITARVLKDMDQLRTRESRIILGAAVIDDVMGLLILAVVAGAIKSAAVGASLSVLSITIIAAKALVFLASAVAIGHYIVPHVFHHAGRLVIRGVLLALAIAFCFLLAWVSSLVGLAPIVGAFAAGLVLDEAHFESFRDHGERRLEELLKPVSTLLVPIFFVLMGLKVDLLVFARPELLGFAAVLTLAAVIGKQVCSLAVLERRINRVAIGLGMIPRGEVGLIFAGIGATLTLPNAQGVSEPVIGAATFGAIVVMVIITTLVTPPALKWSLQRSKSVTEMT